MKARALAIINTAPTFQRKAMIVMAVCLLLALVGYGYFLQRAIGYTVQRGSTLQAIQKVNGDIAELDAVYVTLEKGITIDRAILLGYREVTDPSYITLSDGTPALGIRSSGGI